MVEAKEKLNILLTRFLADQYAEFVDLPHELRNDAQYMNSKFESIRMQMNAIGHQILLEEQDKGDDLTLETQEIVSTRFEEFKTSIKTN